MYIHSLHNNFDCSVVFFLNMLYRKQLPLCQIGYDRDKNLFNINRNGIMSKSRIAGRTSTWLYVTVCFWQTRKVTNDLLLKHLLLFFFSRLIFIDMPYKSCYYSQIKWIRVKCFVWHITGNSGTMDFNKLQLCIYRKSTLKLATLFL